MTNWEKATLMLYLAEENIFEWLFVMISDKDFPLTLNSIVFVLDINRKLTLGSPKAAKIAVIVAAIYRKKSFSRLQIAEFLSQVGFIEFKEKMF